LCLVQSTNIHVDSVEPVYVDNLASGEDGTSLIRVVGGCTESSSNVGRSSIAHQHEDDDIDYHQLDFKEDETVGTIADDGDQADINVDLAMGSCTRKRRHSTCDDDVLNRSNEIAIKQIHSTPNNTNTDADDDAIPHVNTASVSSSVSGDVSANERSPPNCEHDSEANVENASTRLDNVINPSYSLGSYYPTARDDPSQEDSRVDDALDIVPNGVDAASSTHSTNEIFCVDQHHPPQVVSVSILTCI